MGGRFAHALKRHSKTTQIEVEMTVREIEATLAGVAPGWYVFDDLGVLVSGPYDSEWDTDAMDGEWAGEWDGSALDVSYSPSMIVGA